MSTHYRNPLDFDDTKLEEAGKALERIKTCWLLLREAKGDSGVQDKTAMENELVGNWRP